MTITGEDAPNVNGFDPFKVFGDKEPAFVPEKHRRKLALIQQDKAEDSDMDSDEEDEMRTKLAQVLFGGLRGEDQKSEEELLRIREVQRLANQRAKVRFAKRAFFCISRDNPARRFVIRFIQWPWFDRVVLLAIIVNCLLLALDDPTLSDEEKETDTLSIILSYFELFFTIFFLLECLCKIFAMGFCVDPDTYLRAPGPGLKLNWWNILDFFIVVTSFLNFLPFSVVNVSGLRAFRALRPLRTITRLRGLQQLVSTLLNAIPQLGQVLSLCMFLFFVFGIVALQMWKGTFHQRCMNSAGELESDDPVELCYLGDAKTFGDGFDMPFDCDVLGPGRACNTTAGYSCDIYSSNPNYDITSFDNIAIAFLTIYQCITLEGWVDVMYWTKQANGYITVVYFLALIMFGSLFMLNLVVAVIKSKFDGAKEEILAKASETRMLETQMVINIEENDEDWPDRLEYWNLPQNSHMIEPLLRALVKIKGSEKVNLEPSRPATKMNNVRPGVGAIEAFPAATEGDMMTATHPSDGVTAPASTEIDMIKEAAVLDFERRAGEQLMGAEVEALPQQQVGESATVLEHNQSGERIETMPISASNVDADNRPEGMLEQGSTESQHSHEGYLTPKGLGERGNPGNFIMTSDMIDTTGVAKRRTSVTDKMHDTYLSYQVQKKKVKAKVAKKVVKLFKGNDDPNVEKVEFVKTKFRYPLQIYFHKLIMWKWFDRFFMSLIIVNTLVMAAEHHDMDTTFADVLTYTNYTLTFLFTVELVVKLFALDIDYFRDGFNIFDLVIVVLSIVEVAITLAASGAGGGLSAFRSVRIFRLFRVLRVMKLVRYLDELQKIVAVILGSVMSLIYIMMLLFLFMFIFAILGMQLFGGHFRGSQYFENDKYGNEGIPRDNFDNFLWSMVTIFQILTGENWNTPMYNAIRILGWYYCLYFVVWSIIGTYILLNLLLVIILDKFDEEDPAEDVVVETPAVQEAEEEDVSKKNMLMSRDSAAFLAGGYEEHSKRFDTDAGKIDVLTNQLVDPVQMVPARRMKRAPSMAALEFVHISDAPAEGKEEITAAERQNIRMNLKKQQRRESAVWSNAGLKDMLDNPEHWGGKKLPDNKPVVVMDAPNEDVKVTKVEANEKPLPTLREGMLGKSFRVDPDAQTDYPDNKTTKTGAVTNPDLEALAKMKMTLLNDGGDEENENVPTMEEVQLKSLRNWKVAVAVIDTDGYPVAKLTQKGTLYIGLQNISGRFVPLEPMKKSLFCLSPNNRFRTILFNFTYHRYFEWFILFLIMCSSIAMAAEHPDISDTEKTIFFSLDVTFAIIFFFECLFKIVSLGFVIGKQTYLRGYWNQLDFFIVIVSFLSLMLVNVEISFVRAIRLLRTLRPLRVISRSRGMRVVVGSLFKSAFAILNVVAVCLLVWLIYGILGINLFAGKLYYCENDINLDRDECTGTNSEGETRQWVVPLANFDNILNAFLTLFEVASLEQWLDIMFNCVDSTEVDCAPERDAAPYWVIYFISFVCLSSFFFINLFTGVVYSKYRKESLEESGYGFYTPEQREWVDTQKVLLRAKSSPKPQPPKQWIRKPFFYLSYWPTFDYFIMSCIILNVLLMSTSHYNEPAWFTLSVEYINFVFSFIFLCEAVIKLIGLGIMNYFKDSWNRFDFLIVLVSIIDFVTTVANFSFSFLTILRVVGRIFRVTRMMRLVKSLKGLRVLFKTLWITLPSLMNMGALLFLLLFIYSVLGMNLFGQVISGEFLNDDANFQRLGIGMLTLFRMSTGENWNGLMHDCQVEQDDDCTGESCCRNSDDNCGDKYAAALYFPSYIIVVGFVVLNLFVSIILEGFDSIDKNENMIVNEGEIENFKLAWQRYDPRATNWIAMGDLPDLLSSINPPLGAGEKCKGAAMMKHLQRLDIPSHINDGIVEAHFREVLFACAKLAVGQKLPSSMVKRDIETALMKFLPSLLNPSHGALTIGEVYSVTHIQKTWKDRMKKRMEKKLSQVKLQTSKGVLEEMGIIDEEAERVKSILAANKAKRLAAIAMKEADGGISENQSALGTPKLPNVLEGLSALPVAEEPQMPTLLFGKAAMASVPENNALEISFEASENAPPPFSAAATDALSPETEQVFDAPAPTSPNGSSGDGSGSNNDSDDREPPPAAEQEPSEPPPS